MEDIIDRVKHVVRNVLEEKDASELRDRKRGLPRLLRQINVDGCGRMKVHTMQMKGNSQSCRTPCHGTQYTTEWDIPIMEVVRYWGEKLCCVYWMGASWELRLWSIREKKCSRACIGHNRRRSTECGGMGFVDKKRAARPAKVTTSREKPRVGFASQSGMPQRANLGRGNGKLQNYSSHPYETPQTSGSDITAIIRITPRGPLPGYFKKANRLAYY